jgi:hypothetical protein
LLLRIIGPADADDLLVGQDFAARLVRRLEYPGPTRASAMIEVSVL